MKIFDFNIHLPFKVENEVGNTIMNEADLSPKQFKRVFKEQANILKPQVCAVNLMVFNSGLFNVSESSGLYQFVKKQMPGSYISLLIDFRLDNIEEYLLNAREKGVGLIKFHSYVQKLSSNDFMLALKASKFAESIKMPICIDASYGTTGMYCYNNLEFAALISENITKVPIIILHSGGARIFEAMLIAHEKKNVYLETSFSIEYYNGSSIEKDFAFAYKKIGTHRVLFGSDMPYISPSDAIEKLLKYLAQYKFSTSDVENIMYNNAVKLLNG